jgi:hypothetical protein
MNASDLIPRPTDCEAFRRSALRYVPECSGCYTLTTFPGLILYVGLARSLRRRIGEHLDSPIKTSETMRGKAVLVHWIATENLERVERTWMNMHLLAEGGLPLLNRIYSPVSI